MFEAGAEEPPLLLLLLAEETLMVQRETVSGDDEVWPIEAL